MQVIIYALLCRIMISLFPDFSYTGWPLPFRGWSPRCAVAKTTRLAPPPEPFHRFCHARPYSRFLPFTTVESAPAFLLTHYYLFSGRYRPNELADFSSEYANILSIIERFMGQKRSHHKVFQHFPLKRQLVVYINKFRIRYKGLLYSPDMHFDAHHTSRFLSLPLSANAKFDIKDYFEAAFIKAGWGLIIPRRLPSRACSATHYFVSYYIENAISNFQATAWARLLISTPKWYRL